MVCSSRHCWRSSPRPSGGLGAEHHWDADVAEAFGQVDGLVGAALDGRELIQDQQHVIAHSAFLRVAKCPRSSSTRRTAASASVRLAMVGMVSTARSTSSRPQQPSTLPARERKKAE
jgi:hypothetical protein